MISQLNLQAIKQLMNQSRGSTHATHTEVVLCHNFLAILYWKLSALRLFNAEREETQFSWNLNNEKVFLIRCRNTILCQVRSETFLTKMFSCERFHKYTFYIFCPLSNSMSGKVIKFSLQFQIKFQQPLLHCYLHQLDVIKRKHYSYSLTCADGLVHQQKLRPSLCH